MSEAVGDAAGTAMGAFTKKIGPLPGWAWVLIVVGTAYGVFWIRNRGAAGGNTVAVGTTTPAAVGFSSAGPMPGTGTYSGQVDTRPLGQPAVSTNANWAKSVTDFLVGTGNYSPSDVSNAIANYMAGRPLDSQQTAIVNTAIKQYQTPPEGVLPIAAAPSFLSTLRDSLTGAIYGLRADGSRVWLTPDQYKAAGSPAVDATVQGQYGSYARNSDTGQIFGITGTGNRVWLSAAQWAGLGSPTPTTNFTNAGGAPSPEVPSAGHSYTVVEGDTLGSIAQKFYGSLDTSALTAANPGKSIYPGAVITIP